MRAQRDEAVALHATAALQDLLDRRAQIVVAHQRRGHRRGTRTRRRGPPGTPAGSPTGTGHRCWRPAHPPKGRLTALHSRSQPRHTYGFLQTRPHGSPPTQTAASEPPGQLRAAPLPHRRWVPPVRAPGQDFHLRSQTPCPAHRSLAYGLTPRDTAAAPALPCNPHQTTDLTTRGPINGVRSERG